jgi:hypothetical protein
MAAIKAQYHPFLFAFMALSAMAELGLTIFLIYTGNASGIWPRPRYHSLCVIFPIPEVRKQFTDVSRRLIFFCFNSVWTIIFSTAYIMWLIEGAVHFLASIASSVIWMLITTLLWVGRISFLCLLCDAHSRHPDRVPRLL